MNSLQLFNQFVSPAEELLEGWGEIVPYYETSAGSGAMALARHQRPATTIFDRSDGRYLPIYDSELDLAVIRATGRILAEVSSELVGAIRNLCNYTIAEGFKFTATVDEASPVAAERAAPLVKQIQGEINYFLDDNSFTASFDHEIYKHSIIDGEAILHLQMKADRRVRVYRREPDELRTPANTRDLNDWIEQTYGLGLTEEFVPSWSFAVLTRADQPDEPLGYHFVSDESGVNWEYADASKVVHIKRNVPRNAKRGFSDLFPVEGDATRGSKLMRNMTEGATARAAIILIREMVAGATRTGAENLLGENGSTPPRQSTSDSQSQRTERFDRPRIYTVSNGLQYKSPPSAEEIADFLLLAKEVKRQQAVRWSMPEYLFSGDASNAAYASTMVAESPFVKSCEAEQRIYSKYFVDLLWKMLRLRHEAGAFPEVPWEDLERIVKIKAECPTVATRDPLKNVQVLESEVAMGITSLHTAASEQGRDLAAEQALGARPAGAAAVVTAPGTDPSNPDVSAVADTAFNGAQVTSMVDLITQVSAGTLPAESAIQAMLIAFPAITDEQARALIEPAASLAASNGTRAALDADGKPIPGAGGELLGKNMQQVRRIDKLRQGYIDAFRAGEADENTTRLALDGLGYSKAKIDLYLDSNPANDPVDDITEGLHDHRPEPLNDLWEGYPNGDAD